LAITTVPFGDLSRQYASIRAEIDDAVARTLSSGQFILGTEGAAFESEVAQYAGVADAVGVNSGTDALFLSLLVLGVGRGDEVITVANTAGATACAIRMAGAMPRLVDVDERTLTMDPAQVESAIGTRTKAVIPVHLFGQCADMDPITEVARRRGIAVVEDACQAHGAQDRGRLAGTIGDLGCWSFYPSKNLAAYGDGGMVLCRDAERGQALRRARNYGQTTRYTHASFGVNSRLDEIQAAILRVKLRYLDLWNERRNQIATMYSRRLASADVRVPEVAKDRRHVWHLYVVRSRHRDALRAHLMACGIGTQIHYPIPIHKQEAFADLGMRDGDLPVSERAAQEILSLPIFPELTDDEVGYVADAIRSFSPR